MNKQIAQEGMTSMSQLQHVCIFWENFVWRRLEDVLVEILTTVVDGIMLAMQVAFSPMYTYGMDFRPFFFI